MNHLVSFIKVVSVFYGKKCHEASIDKLKIDIAENNLLVDKGDKLYNFMSKKVLSEKAKKSILEIPERR